MGLAKQKEPMIRTAKTARKTLPQADARAMFVWPIGVVRDGEEHVHKASIVTFEVWESEILPPFCRDIVLASRYHNVDPMK